MRPVDEGGRKLEERVREGGNCLIKIYSAALPQPQPLSELTS